jgi:hypothetical protein
MTLRESGNLDVVAKKSEKKNCFKRTLTLNLVPNLGLTQTNFIFETIQLIKTLVKRDSSLLISLILSEQYSLGKEGG